MIHVDEDMKLMSGPRVSLESSGHFFSPIIGTIKSNEQLQMKKQLFRITRGKAYI
jgi:hypothetical protein